jgi:protein-tyrosine phosphatase
MLVIFPDSTGVDATGFTTEIGPNAPTWGLYLYELWQPPWTYRYVAWPDFEVPNNDRDADEAILEAWGRARTGEAVQVGCRGGVGRTGTVLSCMAILAGVEPTEAVSWVRKHYTTRAVDNTKQETWVLDFARRLRS